MNAPNAPNPTNPNAQDQIIGAVQGPTNQAQGPAVQNQAKSLQVKLLLRFQQFRYQFKVLHRSGKIYQFNHHHNQFQYNQPLLVW